VTNTMHPIFLDCCAREEGRYSVERPWVSRGYRYATNGMICVRQATADAETPNPANSIGVTIYPDASIIGWERDLYQATPAPLPAIPDRPLLKWQSCNVPDGCDGGYHPVKAIMRAGDVLLQARFVRILNRHGATAYAGLKGYRMRFEVAGGIEGIVMGVTPSYVDADEIYTAERYIEALSAHGEP
jgi:hypothetical protein